MAWVCVVVLYSVGAALAAGEVLAFLVAGIGITVGLVGSMSVGLTASLLAPRDERIYVRWIWWRWFPLLHGPWMSIGLMTIVGGFVALPIRVMEPMEAGELLWQLGWIAFAAWLVLAPVWWIFWAILLGRAAAALGLRGRSQRLVWVAMGIWAVVVVGGCTLFGFGGGQLGFWFTFRIAGAEQWDTWDF